VAPVGEAAIPLGCADLLAATDLADRGPAYDEPITVAIDENHVAVDLSVSRLQLGALHCVWASRYGASDFHAHVELWVAPSAATSLDPAAEQTDGGPSFAPIAGSPDALIACADSFVASSDDPTLYNSCEAVELRRGYRIEFAATGLTAAAGQDPTTTTELLGTIEAAIDAAGPARLVESIAGTSTPGSVCTAPELAPVFEYLAVEGSPTITIDEDYPTVTDCVWPGLDDAGNASGPYVSVLPGGAWAIDRMRSGVSTFWIPLHPSDDGTYIVGSGEGVEAWRAIGDDLVKVTAYDYDATEGWEDFLATVW
jgi:hypothetical protein